MDIQPIWDDDDNTILRIIYRRPIWTWDDFFAALEQANQMMGETGQPFGVVVDINNGGVKPSDFQAQMKMLHALRDLHMICATAVIGADRFMEALYMAVNANTPTQELIMFCAGLDEAHEVITTAIQTFKARYRWLPAKPAP